MKKTHDIRIDRTKLHPWLNYKLTLLLKQCAKKRIYLIITQGFRSKAQQDELYAQAEPNRATLLQMLRAVIIQVSTSGHCFDIALNMM